MSFFIKLDPSFSSTLPVKGASDKVRKEPTMLAVGRHSVKITEFSVPKANPTDKTWLDINLTFVDDSGKKSWGDVSIPTAKDTFTTSRGDEVPGPAYKAMSFLDAVFGSRELTADNIRKTVGDMRKLTGKTLDIEVGYRNAYAQYTNGVFKLIVKGVALPQEFANREAAEIHAKQNNIRFDRFPKVIKYIKQEKAKLKVVAVTEEDVEY